MIKKITANGRDEFEFLKSMEKRAAETDKKVTETVSAIIDDIRQNGDKAVNAYTEKFDGVSPVYYEVPQEVIHEALTEADEAFTGALLNAIANITEFHTRQKENGFTQFKPDGTVLGQTVRGLNRVGLYVPGGTAAYPSSVLMNAIPAKIAGVKEIIMTTPPKKDGTPNKDILTAAALCGVDRVFMCGGAQAIAALAYGTESVPKADKIVGPGNIYVATAKKLLYGTVDIDMIAGPSEILIIADKTASPAYIAADLLSQAEHDVLASAILITTDGDIADKTVAEAEKQMKGMPREDMIKRSFENYGAVILARDFDEAVYLANKIAPEHLELLIENPFEHLGKIENAGAVFLGGYSPEPLGDYYAGTNHVLPTSGTARFFSPLSVNSFTKKSNFVYYSKQALFDAKKDITAIAGKEGLTAHANAVNIRFSG